MLTVTKILTALSIGALATSVNAQATRTFVSGVGDDANPCSRTAPCKTFAGTISKTTAGGEIDVLDPGGFGALTITKSISIESDGVIAGVLVSGTSGIVVAAGPNDVVVLRGLTFDGATGTGLDGIQIISAGTVIIEHCYIKGFATRGISVEPTSSSGNPTKVFISDTEIQGNTNNGVDVVPATTSTFAQVVMNHVNITGNTNFGLLVWSPSNVLVSNSTITGNAVGTAYSNVRIDGTSGAVLNLDKVEISGAPIGILGLNNGIVRVSDSSIFDNATAISVSGGSTVSSYGNNRITAGSFTGTISLQ